MNSMDPPRATTEFPDRYRLCYAISPISRCVRVAWTEARSLIMLKVEKDLLQVETAQQISKLRQLELQYYIDHIGGI